jgi:hypothetical protein
MDGGEGSNPSARSPNGLYRAGLVARRVKIDRPLLHESTRLFARQNVPTALLFRHRAEQYPQDRQANGDGQHPPNGTVETLLPFLEGLKFALSPFAFHGLPTPRNEIWFQLQNEWPVLDLRVA